MAITINKKGKFNIRISYRIDNDTTKTFSRSSIASREDAELIQAAARKIIKDREYSSLKSLEFTEKKLAHGLTWRKLLMDTLQSKWSDTKTDTSYKNGVLATKYFGYDTIARPTQNDIDRYVSYLKAKKLTHGTKNVRLSSLRVMLKFGKLDRNIEIPNFKQREGRTLFFNETDLKKIRQWFFNSNNYVYSAPPDKRYIDKNTAYEFLLCRLLFLFYSQTGCRPSELNQISTNKPLSGSVTLWISKNDVKRTLPISKEVESLTELLRAIKIERGGKSLVDPYDYKLFVSCWDRMKEELGYQEYTPYSLRHTAATRLAQANVNVFKIQRWMGHKNIKTTLKYVHLNIEDIKELGVILI